MFMIAFFFFIVIHWFACIWFLIANLNQSWIPSLETFTYSTAPVNFFALSLWDMYTLCFYYLVELLLGADILPTNDIEVSYGAIAVFIGNIIVAFIFGNMTSLMATLNKKDNSMQEQLDNIESVMKSLQLP